MIPTPPFRVRVAGESLYSYTLEREAVTGEDSIATIERVYVVDGDVLECVFPRCRWRTRDSAKMWRHVHEGRKHAAERAPIKPPA